MQTDCWQYQWTRNSRTYCARRIQVQYQPPTCQQELSESYYIRAVACLGTTQYGNGTCANTWNHSSECTAADVIASYT